MVAGNPVERLASRIVEDEAQRIPASAHDVDIILGVCDKMHPPLSRMAGTISYQALLSRALVLALPDAPTLAALRFEGDGRLVFDPKNPPAVALDPDAVRHDAIVLVTAFLNLLMTLVGDVVTVRIIRQVWPEVTIE